VEARLTDRPTRGCAWPTGSPGSKDGPGLGPDRRAGARKGPVVVLDPDEETVVRLGHRPRMADQAQTDRLVRPAVVDLTDQGTEKEGRPRSGISVLAQELSGTQQKFNAATGVYELSSTGYSPVSEWRVPADVLRVLGYLRGNRHFWEGSLTIRFTTN